jgi:hypothetical protein
MRAFPKEFIAPNHHQKRKLPFLFHKANVDSESVSNGTLFMCYKTKRRWYSVLLLRPSRGACKQSLCISKYFTASRALFSFGEIIFILALKWNIFVRRLSAESGEEAHTQLAACVAKIIIVRHSSVT